MLNLTDVVIDAGKTLGGKIILTDIKPVFLYNGGQKTDTCIGYKYFVVLPERRFEKIGVKVDGDLMIDESEGSIEVVFDGLEISIYFDFDHREYKLTAKATAIRPVKSKS